MNFSLSLLYIQCNFVCTQFSTIANLRNGINFCFHIYIFHQFVICNCRYLMKYRDMFLHLSSSRSLLTVNFFFNFVHSARYTVVYSYFLFGICIALIFGYLLCKHSFSAIEHHNNYGDYDDDNNDVDDE